MPDMDIAQILPLLMEAQRQQQPSMGPMGGPGLYGELRGGMGGMGPAMPPPIQPDFNAILQQRLANQQREQAMRGQLGMSGAVPPQAMAGDVQAMLMQRQADQMQGMQPPMGFGAGGMGMERQQMPTQPVGTAQLPAGGMQGALGQPPRMGGAPELQNRNVRPY